jgi:hypothetical protein
VLLVQEYVSMSFSADGKMLLAQGGAPEWNLVLWVWEKSKVAATVKTTNQAGHAIYNVGLGWGGLRSCGCRRRGHGVGWGVRRQREHWKLQLACQEGEECTVWRVLEWADGISVSTQQ